MALIKETMNLLLNLCWKRYISYTYFFFKITVEFFLLEIEKDNFYSLKGIPAFWSKNTNLCSLLHLFFLYFYTKTLGTLLMVKIKVSFSAKLMRIFTVSLIIHRQGRISQGTSAAAWFKSKDQNRNYSTLSQVMQLAKL